MTPATDHLKFGDIVRRARLDPDRTQYVLKRLTGMPKAGSQGVHRSFNLRQAMRLAICTLLAGAGVSLKRAGAIASHCEQRVRDSGDEEAQNGLQYSAPGGLHWMLDVLDGRFARCWREHYRELRSTPIRIEFTTRETYFEIESGNVLSQVPEPMTVQRIDLTLLESCLVQKTD